MDYKFLSSYSNKQVSGSAKEINAKGALPRSNFGSISSYGKHDNILSTQIKAPVPTKKIIPETNDPQYYQHNLGRKDFYSKFRDKIRRKEEKGGEGSKEIIADKLKGMGGEDDDDDKEEEIVDDWGEINKQKSKKQMREETMKILKGSGRRQEEEEKMYSIFEDGKEMKLTAKEYKKFVEALEEKMRKIVEEEEDKKALTQKTHFYN